MANANPGSAGAHPSITELGAPRLHTRPITVLGAPCLHTRPITELGAPHLHTCPITELGAPRMHHSWGRGAQETGTFHTRCPSRPGSTNRGVQRA